MARSAEKGIGAPKIGELKSKLQRDGNADVLKHKDPELMVEIMLADLNIKPGSPAEASIKDIATFWTRMTGKDHDYILETFFKAKAAQMPLNLFIKDLNYLFAEILGRDHDDSEEWFDKNKAAAA